jgi:NAD(P)-dependent dehydrogenase (short-subunit alcohol dehydrogenase family)
MARRDGLKVAVVTGAASGLGKALALALARQGWTVVVADVDVAGGEEVARLVRGAGGEGVFEALDVRDVRAWERVAQDTAQRFGRGDLLVNNAGVASSGEVGKGNLDDWRWCVDIDLWGPIHGCHVFVPMMRRQGFGHIVNIASAAGFAHGVRMTPYNVAKAGVISLSETLRGEFYGTPLGVTVVCPSFFPTNIIRSMRATSEKEQGSAQKLLDRSKINADQVAAAILDAVERKRPYVILPLEAQAMFLMRRLFPAKASEFLAKAMAKRTGERA